MISRAASLAEEIESAIAGGTIPLGTRLGTKEELRRHYYVAYGTLNEALRILQQRGYVTSRTGPGGGLFASVPSAEARLSHLILGFHESGTFSDCNAVRHALEPSIAAEAASSCAREDIVQFEALLAHMAHVAEDPVEYLQCNWTLHRRIAQACKNRVLGNLYCTLLDASAAQILSVAADRFFTQSGKRRVAVHRDLISAIGSGDPARARRAAERHEAYFGDAHARKGLKRAPSRP